MGKYSLAFIVISLLLAATNYVASNNLYTSIIVLLASIIYFFLFAFKKFKHYDKRFKIFEECYNFINYFIISLSIKKNISSALDMSIESMDDKFQGKLKEVEELQSEEKINYLSRYFNFDIYGLFLSLINIYQDRGGDILDMSAYLRDELRNNYNYVISLNNIKNKKIIEFSSLWIFSILILVVLRFSLNDFYTKIYNQPFFYLGIMSVFLFLIISIEALFSKALKVDVKGWDYEKH